MRAQLPKISLAALAALALIATARFWYLHFTDPQGEPNAVCDKLDFDPVANSAGWAVSGHFTTCGGFGGSNAVYMYVHPVKDDPGRANLVFRYSGGGGDWPPKVVWKSERELLFEVDRVGQVSKKLPYLGPIKITYKIGKEEFEMTRE